MDFYEYESRLNRPIMMKVPEFQSNERLKHVIFSSQFDRGLLDHLCDVADMIRNLSCTKSGCEYLAGLLHHRRAMLYFTQPSTRTFLSFMAACQIVGLTCNEVRNPEVSSEAKGESPFDSIRMFSSYFDVIIMRTVIPKFAECCACLMNDLDSFDQRSVPIINGGSGADEHPTQALVDMYTIRRTFAFDDLRDSSRQTRFDELREANPELTRGIDGKVYGFCGDIGRGRTVRSLATLLSQYEDITMIFIAPEYEKLALKLELRNELLDAGVQVHEVLSFDDEFEGQCVIEAVDCLYMTRIQEEHNTPEDREAFAHIDLSQYWLNRELVARMKEYAAIMHPFPRVKEIPTELDTDRRSMYFRQARNGMWIRAALIAYLFDVDSRIASQYQKHFSRFHDYNTQVLER